MDLVNGYKCVCELPWSGINCEKKLDPCSPNKCKNGICSPSNNYLDFSCSCQLGYTSRLCDVDINEVLELYLYFLSYVKHVS